MSEVTENITPTETVVEAPVVLEDKRYEWQPTDEDNRPIGAKQVIVYKTEEEFRTKFTDMQNQLIRKLRKQTRDNRLGVSNLETIDDSAPRFKGPTEFKPRVLSKEERVSLSRDLLDEDKFDQAAVTLFEASTGINTADLRQTLTSVQQDNLNLKAQIEADKFRVKNPDFIPVPENIQAVTSWMLRYDLAPVEANFQKAFDTLKAADLLVTSIEVVAPVVVPQPVTPVAVVEPIVEEVVETHIREEIPVENQIPLETVVPETVVPVEPAKPVVSRVPTGLNRNNSGTTGPATPIGDEIVYEYIQRDGQGRQVGAPKVYKGAAALNAMPADEYKRRMLSDKGFTKKAEKVLQDAAKRSRG